jgi:hypothetical protein
MSLYKESSCSWVGCLTSEKILDLEEVKKFDLDRTYSKKYHTCSQSRATLPQAVLVADQPRVRHRTRTVALCCASASVQRPALSSNDTCRCTVVRSSKTPCCRLSNAGGVKMEISVLGRRESSYLFRCFLLLVPLSGMG